MHLLCPPPWGQQDKGMRTDGLREGQLPPSSVSPEAPGPELPSLLGGRTAGRFVYSQKHPLPRGGFSLALSKCVLHFSLPANILPAILLEASSLVPRPLMLWACVRAT